MDFTSLYSCASLHSGSILSPCSSYLLVANPGFLVLRDAVSFQVLQSWKTPPSAGTSISASKSAGSAPALSQLAFSCDSQYCLAVDVPAQTAYVYSVSEDRPVATIKAGQEGLQGARWLENGVTGQRYVAVWARHALRVTVWNLGTGRQHHIQSPKRGPSAGWAIHPVSHDYLALLERHRGKDYLGIYELDTMSLVRHFAIATSDVQDLSWSPCGRYLAAWESCLDYALHIYTPDGRHLASHTLAQGGISGLGVRSVAWHPSGRFLAVGGHDDVVRILNDVSWSVSFEFEVPGNMWASGGGGSGGVGGSKAGSKGKGRMPTHREPAGWLAGPAASGNGSIVSFDSLLVPASQLAHSSSSFSSASAHKASTGSSSRTAPREHAAFPGARELGVSSLLAFSPSGKHLLVQSASPGLGALLVIVRFVRSSPALTYTAARPRVACVVRTSSAVRSAEWRPSARGTRGGADEDTVRPDADADPGGEALALCTGEKSVIMWQEKAPSTLSRSGDGSSEEDEEEEGVEEQGRDRPIRMGHVEGIAVPSKADFAVIGTTWSGDGRCILLQGEKHFCLAYPLAASA